MEDQQAAGHWLRRTVGLPVGSTAEVAAEHLEKLRAVAAERLETAIAKAEWDALLRSGRPAPPPGPGRPLTAEDIRRLYDQIGPPPAIDYGRILATLEVGIREQAKSARLMEALRMESLRAQRLEERLERLPKRRARGRVKPRRRK